MKKKLRKAKGMENYDWLTIELADGREIKSYYHGGRLYDTEVPEGYHKYDLRESDDDMADIASIKDFVLVNHHGTFLTTEVIDCSEEIPVTYWNWDPYDPEQLKESTKEMKQTDTSRNWTETETDELPHPLHQRVSHYRNASGKWHDIFTRTDLDNLREMEDTCLVYYGAANFAQGEEITSFEDNEENRKTFLDILEGADNEKSEAGFIAYIGDAVTTMISNPTNAEATITELMEKGAVTKGHYNANSDTLILESPEGFLPDGRTTCILHMSVDQGYYTGHYGDKEKGETTEPFAGMFAGNPDMNRDIYGYETILFEEPGFLSTILDACDKTRVPTHICIHTKN